VCSENQWTYQSHLLLRVLGSPSTNEHSQCTKWDPGGLEERLLLTEVRRGEMYGKSNMETRITICKVDSQWELSVCLRKLKQGL